MTGWAWWSILTLTHLLSGWCWAAALLKRGSAFERAAGALVFSAGSLVALGTCCALVDRFVPAWLAPLTLAWGVVSATATRHERPLAVLLSDLTRLIDAAREALRAPSALGVLPISAAIALAATVLLIVWFRTWNYDAMVYHLPIAQLIAHHGSLQWPGFSYIWVDGYPFDVSLIAAWHLVFTRESSLDDAGQLSFVVMLMVAVAWWARRLGASRFTSVALGSSALLLPPVWLQSMHTQVDIACAALFLFSAGLLFSSPTTGRAVALAAAMGLYVGTKFTGVLHLVALGPWMLAWLLRLRATEGARALQTALVALVLGLTILGSTRYVVNVVEHDTPFWPFSMRVPLTGLTLPGLIDPGPINSAREGSSGAFFSAPNTFGYLGWSWFHSAPTFWPDVREGGFGPLFSWLALPLLICLAWDVLRRRGALRRSLEVIAVFALALVVPAPWWPRYTIAAGSIAVAAFALVFSPGRPRLQVQMAAACFVAFSLWGVGNVVRGLRAGAETYKWPEQLAQVRDSTATERQLTHTVDWQWPRAFLEQRDALYADGGVLLYDEAIDFPSEFFARGLRNDVRFASSLDGGMLASVADSKPCWIFVTDRSAIDPALLDAGMHVVFAVPRTQGRIWATGLCAEPSFGPAGASR